MVSNATEDGVDSKVKWIITEFGLLFGCMLHWSYADVERGL
jgi:hypothetical protein